MTDLLQLQNRIKRDPEGYKEEFLQQYGHFQSSLQIFQLGANENARSQMKKFGSLITFLSHTAQCYRQDAKNYPQQLIDLLEAHSDNLGTGLRRTITQALILLQNRKLVDRLQLLPLFFRLFGVQDKTLRELLFGHIINDIRRINQGKKNVRVNTTLQQFMYKILKGENETSAKKSLDVMIELWRRRIWNDDKTVNVLVEACFSKHGGLLPIALSFFIGCEYYEDFADEDSSVLMKQATYDFGIMRVAKRRKKRQRQFDRTVNNIRKKEKMKEEQEFNPLDSLQPINLVYDAESFAERLFAKLKTSGAPFETRLMMMNVISRLIGAHELMLFNFYPFLQKYMQPHQRSVTKLLAYLAQASHRMVPPAVVQPCIKTLANHFVTDRSRPEIMAVGLNGIREVCLRCPLAMTDELLQDLVQYKKSKQKGVMMAARSLISLFRELNPELLVKKDRGRDAQMIISNRGSQMLDYGEEKSVTDLPGMEFLDADGQVPEYNSDSDEEDEKDEKDENDEKTEGAGPTETGDIMFTEENEDEEDDEENHHDEKSAMQTEEQGEDQEKASEQPEKAEEAENKVETKQVKKKLPLGALRIFSSEELQRLARIQSDPRNSSRKRHREDGSTLLRGVNSGDAVDPDEIVGWQKKKKLNKEERIASIMEGREGRGKFNDPNRKKGGGSTNLDKLKNKSFVMVKHSYKVRSKALTSMHLKQKSTTAHIKSLKKAAQNNHSKRGKKK